MSKNITVSEGNTARVFGNTKKLETKLQGDDAGTCFWVSEDETDAQPLYITENGLYEASEAGVYGFSEAHVNISKKVTDDDGTDWNIHIDDDGIPHITVDDPDDPYSGPDISIDDGTGDIDVHIPGKDPDDWPEWDNLDPDVKPEFDDWMDDPKIPGDWPGWDDVDPDVKIDFDDWVDDGNDPDIWPGWDDLDPDEKTDFDDWMDDPKDPDDWPGWEDIDPEIKTDFDDWTADIDTEIDPEEAGLDPDEDVDASFDPETGETVITNLPYSIRVVTPPAVTEYNDGAKINFSGMVVKGYLKSGDLWTDSSHPNGIIPISELVLPVTVADTDETSGANMQSDLVPEAFPCTGVGLIAADDKNARPGEPSLLMISYTANAVTLFWPSQGLTMGVAASDSPGQVYTEVVNNPDGSSTTRTSSLGLSYSYLGKTVYYRGWSTAWGYSSYTINSVSPDATAGQAYSYNALAWTMIYGDITSRYQVIPVQYMSGGKMLGSSFTIAVKPS